jgi:hypothetical protein
VGCGYCNTVEVWDRRAVDTSAVIAAMTDKSTEVPNAAPTAGVLLGHGLFLAGCGVYGAAMNGWAPKAMHSAYAGGGGCAALAVCAALSVGGSRKLYMIGVHIGLLLQVAFTGVFAMQAYKSYGVPEKVADGRFALFCVMGLGSVVALGLMRALKPKKNKAS